MTTQTLRVDSPIGVLQLTETNGAISHCSLAEQAVVSSGQQGNSVLLTAAAGQLEEYFAGQRHHFELPLAATGTAFQQAVWRCLQTIPYGDTWSYQQLAGAVGQPGASRAVGSANGKNPLWIIVPCHRVIRGNGELGGYAGGVERKAWLLEMESRQRLSGDAIVPAQEDCGTT